MRTSTNQEQRHYENSIVFFHRKIHVDDSSVFFVPISEKQDNF